MAAKNFSSFIFTLILQTIHFIYSSNFSGPATTFFSIDETVHATVHLIIFILIELLCKDYTAIKLHAYRIISLQIIYLIKTLEIISVVG